MASRSILRSASLLGAAFLAPAALAATPAFPGAEGFGASASGGRGGKVVYVDNLDDSGSGSLRSALGGWGARTIVFRVGGEIRLRTPLPISGSNITVAGQTAPGDGITVRGAPVLISGDNIVIRFIRSRMGSMSAGEEDAISIMKGAHRVILDHVSASWSIDETLSPSGDVRDVTIQWCTIAESLNHSHHKKGPHGYGMLLRATGGVSLHHNLFAHHRGRNPRFGDNYGGLFQPIPTFDFRNNVIYDWGDYASGLVDGNIRVNYVGNYLKPGPSTKKFSPITLTEFVTPKSRFHIAGNIVDGHPEITSESEDFFTGNEGKGRKDVTLSAEPFEAPPLTTQDAAEAYLRVLALAGNVVPARDAVDTRVIEDVRHGTGHLIDSQDDVGGWPKLASGPAPLDSDGDGIPDEWELAHGLDPKDAKDGSLLQADGYSNLEHYLNELADQALAKLAAQAGLQP